MKCIAYLILLIFLCAPTSLFAQSIDIGNPNGVSHPVDLLFNIFIDHVQNAAPAGLSVQLSATESGTTSLTAGSRQTDNGGTVLFHTFTGILEYRISGPGIQDYTGQVQMLRQETHHVENIVVRSKPGAQVGSSPGNADTISASHLKAPGKAVSEFRAGSKALEDKNYPEAQKRFERAISIYNDYDVAYNGLGVAQMASGDQPAARASFEKAIKIDDHFAEAYRNLGRIALADKKYEEVDELLTKSLEAEPLNAWALTYAAYAELQTRKFDQAISHARSAHTIAHPGLASVHIVAAHAFEATNKPDEALTEYRLYLEEDPTGRDAARAKEAVAQLSNHAKAN